MLSLPQAEGSFSAMPRKRGLFLPVEGIEPKALHSRWDRGGAPLSEVTEEVNKALKTGPASELEPFPEFTTQGKIDEETELLRARVGRFQKLPPKRKAIEG